MTARHSHLFTLESGQSGLGIYTSGRFAAHVGLHHHGVEGLIHTPPGLKDRGQEAARAEFRDPQIDVAHLGARDERPVAVAVTKTILTAFMAIGTEHGGDLQLDQLLQAMAHQFREQLPGAAAIQ